MKYEITKYRSKIENIKFNYCISVLIIFLSLLNNDKKKKVKSSMARSLPVENLLT